MADESDVYPVWPPNPLPPPRRFTRGASEGPPGPEGPPGDPGPPGDSVTVTVSDTPPASPEPGDIWVQPGTDSGIAVPDTFVKKAGDTMTGDLIIGKSNPALWLSAAPNQVTAVKYLWNGTTKWTAETGGAGAWNVARFDSGGAFIDYPISAAWDTGLVTVNSKARHYLTNHKTTTQNIPNATATTVSSWTTQQMAGVVSLGGGVYQIKQAGVYSLTAWAALANGGTGNFVQLANTDGSVTYALAPITSSFGWQGSTAAIVQLAVNDTVCMKVFHNQGAAQNLTQARIGIALLGGL